MFIDGVAFNGYRSFGKEVQRIGPLSKLNFFIGQNNSGKSNVLSWVHEQYIPLIQAVKSKNKFDYYQTNKHVDAKNLTPSAQLGIRPSESRISEIATHFRTDSVSKEFVTSKVENILRSKTLFSNDVCWMPFIVHDSNLFIMWDRSLSSSLNSENLLNYEEWRLLWYAATGSTGGDLEKNWIPDVLNKIAATALVEINIQLIPAIRKIGDPGSTISGLGGQGIIDQLATLQNPVLAEIHKKKQFQQINSLLQEVCGNATITLEIPHDRKSILVHMDDRSLPLSSLGTGIHEVVILAAAATLIENSILCIEEPELHLHPTLQKKLVRYLRDKTSNQYFITTHSAHLMDTVGASIFHVKHENGSSTISLLNSPSEKSAVCSDLGYAASDLLQSNCVIWVEGPSDRIHIKHWIHSIDPKLKDGLHYSIMFYGGRLLSHLTANDPEIDDFISLRRLNRHISIVIDSDKSTMQAEINATKQRVRDEFNQGNGFAWITEGREIENYVPFATLEKAVKTVHPKVKNLKSDSRFAHVLDADTEGGTFKDVDKVKVAHEVIKQPANLDILDLRSKITKLVEFIKQANRDTE